MKKELIEIFANTYITTGSLIKAYKRIYPEAGSSKEDKEKAESIFYSKEVQEYLAQYYKEIASRHANDVEKILKELVDISVNDEKTFIDEVAYKNSGGEYELFEFRRHYTGSDRIRAMSTFLHLINNNAKFYIRVDDEEEVKELENPFKLILKDLNKKKKKTDE